MIDLCKSFSFLLSPCLLRAPIAAEDGEDAIMGLSVAPLGCSGD